MINLTNDNFKTEVIESDKSVIVDFFSVGCGPCRVLEPILKVVEGQLENFKFAKAAPDDAMDLFVDNNVKVVPTLIKFQGGKEVDRHIGVMAEKDLIAWIQKGN
jgi:thioredoxin